MCQELFTQTYNPLRSADYALTQAIKSSLGHNSTYTPNINPNLKNQFKNRWRAELITIGNLFVQQRDINFYYEQVIRLQQTMNETFYNLLMHPNPKYEYGFRISHSQKSISIYLKHLWCIGNQQRGEVFTGIPEPPCCPIDGIMQRITGVHYNRPWTQMNDLNEVSYVIDQFQNLARRQNLTIAMWECQLFQNH